MACAQSLVLRFDSRYTETSNLQPLIVRSAQAKMPEGDPKANRGSYYLSGYGSHLVDTARFLGGEIIRVKCQIGAEV